MGIYVIRMPDIGEGIAEVELVAWHVQPGDVVAEDQPIADVMTDKATVEIPAHVPGKVLALGGAVGQVLAVGAELVRLEVEGEGNLKENSASALASQAPAAINSVANAPAAAAPAPAPAAAPAPAPAAPREAPAPAAGGARGAARTAPAAVARSAGERPLASPAVRRAAQERGIDLRYVHGSGPAGRISHEDLDAWAASAGQPAAQGRSQYVERHGEEQIPVIGLRRKIAQKMQEAKRRIPHFSYVEEIDVTELEALRQRLNQLHGATRGKLTLLPFLARAMVLALRDFPQINARYDDDAGVVTRYEAVHLGVATQTDGGLMVPVLRHAESLDLWQSAASIARVAEGARTGKAARDELSGSTITLTSLGALGGIASTPVINHPEVAIVGVNRMVERPMFQGGHVVARQLMNLSSSFDHRVVDGMDAARFIQAMRALLETPALLFVE
ncbi:dihydrolipoamide acetyltransferase family protein [Pulveribacter suum]|uniref:Dihydrolipoamide acetyltransferase component of pyruvate dehydrogenase complex n=1 Tax=Pulveribacter suum TaxID=2116657 RepID=A0A2P1NP93_9BURK|nr:dihydrolipoamide acetyltransferase family protein [Pulveribacter suum]AVP58880.1 branched-chain alpha-keto acid dehydrogenase subunit E2 [Pulveribacter suum]